ncbi:anti-sigma factor [Phaeocystidibacter luteus]|uniref:Anti-sigma factor n=1 Tax=Phaeocystidibacter luteus TaxID=911197 RepID=A0A6N6RDE0_9FLAO|nr:anti-sigma factor [Phaeocystidibacter luteus]KAB2807044.1 anti-sigma factor [Phaeocystidibacter luteus]
MDIKQYIGSGILEDFVLGMTSEQEQREVQCLSKIYPEIASYIATIEDELADAVMVDAVTPPQDLKSRILENLPERDEADLAPVAEKPVMQVVHDEEPAVAQEHSTKRNFPWGIAASLVVIIGLGGLYMNALTKANTQEGEILELTTEKGLAQEEIESLSARNSALASNLEILTDPGTERITLNATGDQAAQVLVYWNPETQDVLLESVDMPAVPEGSQYQLWTLVDGQPIDQGMLPLDDSEGLARMKSAGAADAFAITLEPEGGSVSPTLEKLIVLGTVEG